jgi:hypothetical protein
MLVCFFHLTKPPLSVLKKLIESSSVSLGPILQISNPMTICFQIEEPLSLVQKEGLLTQI